MITVLLFIFVILYRPTLLTRRFDIFDNLDWQPDPLLCCVFIVFQYWMAAYTEVLFLLSQGNEMNSMNVWCAVFQFVYFLDLSISFIAHFSFISNDIMSIMFSQSPTPKFHNNIICQHIECLCHQLYLQFQEMYAVIPIFHFILLYLLNLIYS